MNRRYVILGGLAAVGAGAWALGNFGSRGRGDALLVSPAQAQSSSDIDTSGIADMVLGNPDAPVTVVEYASFTCPHCQTFHMGAYKQLKEEFIDTGKIKFVYREVYFDRPGLWASMLARCGGPERFFGIVDMLYQGQSTWARAGDPSLIVEELRKIGRLAGLTNETLETCFQDADMAQTLVAWWQENSETDDVNSTPSFVINGRKHSNMSFADMKALIEAELS